MFLAAHYLKAPFTNLSEETFINFLMTDLKGNTTNVTVYLASSQSHSQPIQHICARFILVLKIATF